MKNKNGFTLIELLAVIVVLAVIILIASTNVGTMMTTARKNALAIEGNTLVNSAKQAYQIGILNGGITGTQEVCFSLADLKAKGYFEKSDSDYQGSVLIQPDANGVVSYKFWISNKSYEINNANPGDTGSVASSLSQNKASTNCGGKTVTAVS